MSISRRTKKRIQEDTEIFSAFCRNHHATKHLSKYNCPFKNQAVREEKRGIKSICMIIRTSVDALRGCRDIFFLLWASSYLKYLSKCNCPSNNHAWVIYGYKGDFFLYVTSIVFKNILEYWDSIKILYFLLLVSAKL